MIGQGQRLRVSTSDESGNDPTYLGLLNAHNRAANVLVVQLADGVLHVLTGRVLEDTAIE